MTNAGYSGTPQLKKLGIVPGARWALLDAPAGWRFETQPDVDTRADLGESADVLVAFVTAAAQLERALDVGEEVIFPAGALWIAWPRRAGGHTSDLTDSVVRDAALRRKLVDTKVAALDEDWSAMKLVWRKEHRAQ